MYIYIYCICIDIYGVRMYSICVCVCVCCYDSIGTDVKNGWKQDSEEKVKLDLLQMFFSPCLSDAFCQFLSLVKYQIDLRFM